MIFIRGLVNCVQTTYLLARFCCSSAFSRRSARLTTPLLPNTGQILLILPQAEQHLPHTGISSVHLFTRPSF